jgi:hypothetical protein
VNNMNRMATFVPVKLNRRRGRCTTLERRETSVSPSAPPYDSAIANLARAFYWQHLLDEGRVSSGAEIAEREGLHVSTVNELLRLALLDPEIVTELLTSGALADATSLTRLVLPVEWQAQPV